jgi:hypothetical protein
MHADVLKAIKSLLPEHVDAVTVLAPTSDPESVPRVLQDRLIPRRLLDVRRQCRDSMRFRKILLNYFGPGASSE